jgi:Tol biopolymer transport system component
MVSLVSPSARPWHALAVVLLLVVPGCGGGDDPGDDPTAPNPELAERIAFSVETTTNEAKIALMNPDGTGVVTLTPDAPTGYARSPRWSPDGRLLAFASRCPIGNQSCIYVMEADGSNVRRLTANATGEVFPAWSPDGTKIAFAGGSSLPQLYVSNADGTGLTQLTSGREYAYAPAWSPDGRRIAFMRGPMSESGGAESRGDDIYLINPDGSGLTLFLAGAARDAYPAWSPDGSMIAFVSERAGTTAERPFFGLYLVNAAGTAVTQLAPTLTGLVLRAAPTWSRDGRRLAFCSLDGPYSPNSPYSVYTIGADGVGLTNITRVQGMTTKACDPAWRP